uniref:N-acetyltransferase 8 like n=1 Tax=Anas platyrhynchos platyrhynchos TaxID=8840 RepID=A0A493TZ53_ANAPP
MRGALGPRGPAAPPPYKCLSKMQRSSFLPSRPAAPLRAPRSPRRCLAGLRPCSEPRSFPPPPFPPFFFPPFLSLFFFFFFPPPPFFSSFPSPRAVCMHCLSPKMMWPTLSGTPSAPLSPPKEEPRRDNVYIREFHPSEQEVVRRIFYEGIMERIPNTAFRGLKQQPLTQLLYGLLAVICFVVTKSFLLTCCLPIFLMGMRYYFSRKVILHYLDCALHTDMSDIEQYYMKPPDVQSSSAASICTQGMGYGCWGLAALRPPQCRLLLLGGRPGRQRGGDRGGAGQRGGQHGGAAPHVRRLQLPRQGDRQGPGPQSAGVCHAQQLLLRRTGDHGREDGGPQAVRVLGLQARGSG